MTFWQTLCLFLGIACSDVDPRAAYYQEYLGVDATTISASIPLTQGVLTLAEMTGGKPIVLNVWATWCPPCVHELPSLARLAAQGEYHVIALAVDRQPAVLATFLEKNAAMLAGLTVWYQRGGAQVAEMLGASAYPITYLLDATGTVQAIYTGPREWDHPSMVAKLAAALQP